MEHLSDRDLVNFARDELGEGKKRRMLAHGRECAECAERLIEATREHAPDPAPFRLTRTHKISLAALVVALLALILTMVWFVRQLGQQAPVPLPAPNAEAEVR